MARKSVRPQRREAALTREQIIEAAIELLDSSGESGLTFRALSELLSTGPGAIYGHIAGKDDLLSAACDAIIARVVDDTPVTRPKATVRAVALRLFDAIDEHPWVGSALSNAPGLAPAVRVLECVGRQIQALGVPPKQQWPAVGALLGYILGVGRQNAANRQTALTRGLHRDKFLDSVATAWSELDAKQYPFSRSVAAQMRHHDDREDFLAGIDLILRGIDTLRAR